MTGNSAPGSGMMGGSMTKVKICGLTRQEDITAVNRFLPDYVGFVFAPSRRQVTAEQAADLSSMLRPDICPVGVFVNGQEYGICSLAEQGIIRMIQLHGQETPEQVLRLKRRLPSVPLIKAVRMELGHRLDEWQQSAADYLLLDADAGGTGTMFDHSLIEQMGRITKPWFLAGGMSPDNAAAAVRRFHPFGVDVSSGVETGGKKDERKIERMIRSVRDE